MRGYATCSIVANPINRYSISPRQNLKTNSNGSTDLYIQNESPGTEKESNWRPAPKGKFVLMLRMYWPDEDPPSIIDGMDASGGEEDQRNVIRRLLAQLHAETRVQTHLRFLR